MSQADTGRVGMGEVDMGQVDMGGRDMGGRDIAVADMIAPATDEASSGKSTRWARVKAGLIRFLIMFAYLLVVLTLFQMHEYLILEEHGLPFTRFGFATINAFLLAKVMLLGEEFKLGQWSPHWPRIYPILGRSAIYTVLFILFDVAEKTLRGVIDGRTILESIPHEAGGVTASIIVGVILFVMLVPFFAFAEISQVFGRDKVRRALFSQNSPAPP
ncbi:hypothetical protein [Blastochloris tepida]|uniref:Uncharacterized protein n=1 Tax=Blastochloris tepida TaxID=2233851 RepID=A0A348FZ50_9HYPH|nr:hypothetical protein [Blastochloris tepida]BBF92583.1 hypothetical protein BLTE_12680 [Blastochloris tepida]